MTLSTKPEVHDVSQRRQRRTEPQGHRQHAQISDDVEVGPWCGLGVREQTDRQTHTHTHTEREREREKLINMIGG